MWKLFANQLTEQGIKVNPYLMDTLKHLINIATGAIPGLRPDVASEVALPLKTLKKAYKEVYEINYAPIIMQPHYFDINKPFEPVYYSLQIPTLFETTPKSKHILSVLAELRKLKNLLEDFIDYGSRGYLKIQNTPIQTIVEQGAFDFYHSDLDSYGGIKTISELAKNDPVLKKFIDQTDTLPLPENCAFFKGCVRIGGITKGHPNKDYYEKM